MVECRWKLLAAALVVVWICQNSVDAAALRSGRHRGSRRSRTDPGRPYYWMCPEVRCPAVSADCETIEYIVFQYDYEVRGRVINVRCESCEYCLDVPSFVAPPSRRRRTIRHLQQRSSDVNTPECPEIHCPALPVGCHDERLTDVLVAEHVCKRCPACYDSTVFNAWRHIRPVTSSLLFPVSSCAGKFHL